MIHRGGRLVIDRDKASQLELFHHIWEGFKPALLSLQYSRITNFITTVRWAVITIYNR